MLKESKAENAAKPGRRNVYSQKYYQEHREDKILQQRKYSQQNPDKAINGHLKKKFGITLEEYEALFVAQGGVCAICHRPETSRYRDTVRLMAVDHNHETQKIRGLLCSWCNLAIGYLKDDPLRALALADYLEKTDG